MQSEQEIFDDLSGLCVSPGYVHVIAYFCFRDNAVGFADELTADDLAHLFSTSRLIRTEISTLIGLLVRQPIDYTLPTPETMQAYIEQTERLLNELHMSMTAAWFGGKDPATAMADGFDPFAHGEALREPIFYGGESAYSFQYRELAHRKYAEDDEWLEANKGFYIQAAKDVVSAIGRLLNEKQRTTLRSLKSLSPEKWTMLPCFEFTVGEIAERAKIGLNHVKAVVAAFSLPANEMNAKFNALHDFNATNATPLLRRNEDKFILFQYYSLVEALYETPFYWMGADRRYAPKALGHRGQFTETFARDRLEHVFGGTHVYANVDIVRKKGEKLGEIDVLVLFGNRAIIVQAKSKRLTLEARKGNDLQIRDDFKKAVQDAYDQAYECARALTDPDIKLVDLHGKVIKITVEFKEIYPVCVVSDHYPALAFQARHFLVYQTTENIMRPMVIDVFALDAITEMLDSPLRFLSYLDRRVRFAEKLMATHEHTLLSYHLKYNLWVDEDHDLVLLNDDISADLDVAMAVRRDGIRGARTPDGILTRIPHTAVGRMIADIEARPDPAIIDFAMLLLQLSEDAARHLSRAIDKIAADARRDGRVHDITVGFEALCSGLTVHCSNEPEFVAMPSLMAHCEARKYAQKADRWFGIVIRPEDRSIRFGAKLQLPWKHDERIEELVRSLPVHRSLAKLSGGLKRVNVGRNAPCPCGSGRKFKKCCISR